MAETFAAMKLGRFKAPCAASRELPAAAFAVPASVKNINISTALSGNNKTYLRPKILAENVDSWLTDVTIWPRRKR